MDFLQEIQAFSPASGQEETDKQNILRFAENNPDLLHRSCVTGHITSSGFIMNPALTKVLLVHHNIRGVWAWTGGHADGNPNLLEVALQEAEEETGAAGIRPLSREIASIDILPVFGHVKNGQYVSAHLHHSVAYLLICNEDALLTIKPDENSGVDWFSVEDFNEKHFDASDVYLYNKLIRRAKQLR